MSQESVPACIEEPHCNGPGRDLFEHGRVCFGAELANHRREQLQALRPRKHAPGCMRDMYYANARTLSNSPAAQSCPA